MKDNQNKEIIINDTPIIPLGNINKDINENTLKVGNNALNKNEDNNIDLNLIQPDQTDFSDNKNLNNTSENIFNDNTSIFDSSKISESENIESKDTNYIFDNNGTNIISQSNVTQEINSSNENNISFDATLPLNDTISNVEVNNTYDDKSNTTQDSMSNIEGNINLDTPLYFGDIQSNLEVNNAYDSQSNTSQDSISNIEGNINLDTPLHFDDIQSNLEVNNAYDSQSNTSQDNISNIENNISLNNPLHFEDIQNNVEANNTYDNKSNTTQDNISNIEGNINLDTPLHYDDIQSNVEVNNAYANQSNTTQDNVSNIENNIILDDNTNNIEANNTYDNQSNATQDSISNNNEKKTELNDNNIIIENKDNNSPEQILQDQVNLNNLENTVTLGTSENNKKEEKKSIFSKIKNIMNKTMLIIFLVVIISIILGTVIYFITTAKNKEKRLNNMVNIFIEKSNIGELENIIGFVDNIANGNIPKAANYVNEEYNFKISLNTNIENIKNLADYNYTLTVSPQENYNKYRVTISDGISENYLLNVSGISNDNNSYYRFNGLSDPNTYVRTPETTEGFNLLFPNNLNEISLTTNYNNMLNKIKEIYSQKEFETSNEEISINQNSYKVYKDSILFTKEEVTNIIKEFTNGLLEVDTNNIYDLKLDFYTNRKDNKPLKIDINFNENLITILFINDTFKVYNYDNTNKTEFNVNEEITSLFYTLQSENNYNSIISYSHSNDELVLSLNGTFNDKDLSLNIKGRKDNITEILNLDIENSIHITEFNNPNFIISLIPTPFYKTMYQYN